MACSPLRMNEELEMGTERLEKKKAEAKEQMELHSKAAASSFQAAFHHVASFLSFIALIALVKCSFNNSARVV